MLLMLSAISPPSSTLCSIYSQLYRLDVRPAVEAPEELTVTVVVPAPVVVAYSVQVDCLHRGDH